MDRYSVKHLCPPYLLKFCIFGHCFLVEMLVVVFVYFFFARFVDIMEG